MDENMSDDDNKRDNAMDGSAKDNPKRLKTHNSSEKSEESSSSSNKSEQETASTSTDSGFPRRRNSKNRNYRHKRRDSEDSESSPPPPPPPADEDVQMRSSDNDPTEETNAEQCSSPASSDSTVIHDTDTESEEDEEDDPPALKKQKPQHNWRVVPQVINRQYGWNAKLQGSELFQRRCYGSLHCVERLELMEKLEEHEGCVNSLNFHPNGSLLASGSDDLKVVIWDWRIGKCLLKYDTKHRGNVFQSKFLNLSGDLHIATCARDGQVRIAQVSSEEGLRDSRKLGSHKGACHKLALLPDQPHLLLSAGEDAVVLSHDVRRNKPEKMVTVRDDLEEIALYSIHANPLRTNEFCVCGRNDSVRVYDQRKSRGPLALYHPFKKPSEFPGTHITCAVYNHDGSQILASYNDADIYLFDVNQPPGEFVHNYQGHRNGATIKGVNFFGPKSEFIVSGSDCGNVYFWEKNTECIVQWMLADDNGVVNCLEPHPQLPFICTSGLDWDVKVWLPSCEKAPAMDELAETVKSNKSRINFGASDDINESQMLWMLWRHLRNSTNSRLRRDMMHETGNILLQLNTNSSSSDSSMSGSNSSNENDEDDDDIGGPTGCATS